VEKRKAYSKSIEATGLRSRWSKDKVKGEVVGDSRNSGEDPKNSRRRNSER